MIHSYVEKIPEDGVIRGEAAHHLSVLRIRVGEELELLDGMGHRCRMRVEEAGKREVRCVALGAVEEEARLEPRVTVFQCIAKATHMEWLVEKSVELGVERMVPVVSRNCVSRPEVGSRVGRWDRIAGAALEQCGGAWRMELDVVHSWVEALERVRGFEGVVLTAALPEGTPQLREVLEGLPREGSRRYGIFVGPEGDFADYELEQLREAGSRFVGLGPTVLRTDTATVAAVSCVRLMG